MRMETRGANWTWIWAWGCGLAGGLSLGLMLSAIAEHSAIAQVPQAIAQMPTAIAPAPSVPTTPAKAPALLPATLLAATTMPGAMPGAVSTTPPGTGTAAAAIPSPVLNAMVKLANVTRQDVIYELGGEGQITATVAKGLGNTGGLYIPVKPATAGDKELPAAIAKANLAKANVLFLFLSPELNLKLRPRLLSNLQPGTRIVSYLADMGDWQPDLTQPIADNASATATRSQTLQAWTVPANIQGNWQGSLAVAPGRPAQTFTLQFTQQFQKAQGVVVVDSRKVPMQKVSLVGDRLSFSRAETVEGQPVTVNFSGKVNGNTLQGTADVQMGFLSRSFPIVAQRQ